MEDLAGNKAERRDGEKVIDRAKLTDPWLGGRSALWVSRARGLGDDSGGDVG